MFLSANDTDYYRNTSGIESESVSEFQSADPSHLTYDLIVLFNYDKNFGIFPILLIILFLFSATVRINLGR